MRVAVKAALRNAVLSFVACQVPYDQGLVARSGQKHVRAAITELDLSFFSRVVMPSDESPTSPMKSLSW